MFVVGAEEALLIGVGPLTGAPHEGPAPHPGHDFVQQQLQLAPVLVVDGHQKHAVLRQQVAGQGEPLIKELQPGRVAVLVIAVDVVVVI
jgi:hypothetical protein